MVDDTEIQEQMEFIEDNVDLEFMLSKESEQVRQNYNSLAGAFIKNMLGMCVIKTDFFDEFLEYFDAVERKAILEKIEKKIADSTETFENALCLTSLFRARRIRKSGKMKKKKPFLKIFPDELKQDERNRELEKIHRKAQGKLKDEMPTMQQHEVYRGNSVRRAN